MPALRKSRRPVQSSMPDVLCAPGAIGQAITIEAGSNASHDSPATRDTEPRADHRGDAALTFSVPGEPVAKGRARAFIRGGKIGHHTPDKTARYENLVRLVAKQAIGAAKPLEGPISLRCTFWLSVPMSHSNKRRKACLNGSERHCKRPDIDNLLKSVKDGCNGVVWVDDCQVVEVIASKRYGVVARADIEVVRIVADCE
jgi:Holliday junction resolvase RusA-like endonuclease